MKFHRLHKQITMPSLFSGPIFWVLLALLAFAFLPSQALHYGLSGATRQEFWQAMGWNGTNYSWVWFASLLVFPFSAQISSVRQRSRFELAAVAVIIVFILVSARWWRLSFGYAVIFLAVSLVALAVQALARLNVMRGDRFVLASLLLVVVTNLLFVLYPTLSLFAGMFENGNPLSAVRHSYLLRLIRNSLSISLTVGVSATFLGLIFALYTSRIAGKRTRFIGKLFSILPIITPPFVVGLGVTLMLGRSGYITALLTEHFGISPNWLYGFNGIVLAHTLALTPMAFMILESALKAADVSLEEISYTLRGGNYRTLRFILLPLLRPALANAFLVVTVQSLADFGTPLVLGGNFDVLASQIYFYIVGTQVDYPAASTLGTVLLAFSLFFFLIQYKWIGRKSYVTVSGKGHRSRAHPLPKGLKRLIITLFSLWSGFTALLYGSIFYGSFTVNWGVDHSLTLDNYLQLFGQGLKQGGFPSLIQTVIFALCAAPITAVSGFLSAYVLSRQQFAGKQGLEFITLLCFAVPGTVAGVSYVLAFNHAPFYLTGTGAIIVLSMVTRNMPIGMRACTAALEQIDKSLDEASLSLRGSTFKTLVHVIFPLMKSAFFSALVTGFVRAMTTVSAVIFLVSPSTRVAASYILNRVEDGAYGAAVAYGATLIVVMLMIILLFNRWVKGKNTE